MGDTKLSILVKAGSFALGAAILLFAFSNIIMSAAYVIARGLMYMDFWGYSIAGGIGSAILGFIGCFFIFLGWHAEEYTQ
ncbi:MAG: hypothetical protein ACXABF_14695 [Candidatus Thorarchaeota archaeon]|jgi:phosphotransferase system  glucose/maltose/N-acetylglucosamine-specific IIC component